MKSKEICKQILKSYKCLKGATWTRVGVNQRINISGFSGLSQPFINICTYVQSCIY